MTSVLSGQRSTTELAAQVPHPRTATGASWRDRTSGLHNVNVTLYH